MSSRMMQVVCVTTVTFAHDHSDTVRGIIAACKEGLDYVRAHPEEAANILAKAYINPDTALYRTHMKELVARPPALEVMLTQLPMLSGTSAPTGSAPPRTAMH